MNPTIVSPPSSPTKNFTSNFQKRKRKKNLSDLFLNQVIKHSPSRAQTVFSTSFDSAPGPTKLVNSVESAVLGCSPNKKKKARTHPKPR